MQLRLLSCALAATLLSVSACSRPETTITIQIKIPAKSTASPLVGMTGTIKGAAEILDASSMALDVSNSTISFPANGTVTLGLFNSAGVLMRIGTFGWTRYGQLLKFSSPSSVNNWLSTSGANPSTSRIDYTFADFAASMPEEGNLVAATVKMYSQPLASAASSYSGGGGGGGCTPLCEPQ